MSGTQSDEETPTDDERSPKPSIIAALVPEVMTTRRTDADESVAPTINAHRTGITAPSRPS
jgi:hypothetical protein